MRLYELPLLLASLWFTTQSVAGGLVGGITGLSPLYARSASGQDLGVRGRVLPVRPMNQPFFCLASLRKRGPPPRSVPTQRSQP